MRTEGNGRTADVAYTHGAYVFYAQRPRRTTSATASRRLTDATDGIDRRQWTLCACLPRNYAKALTGKETPKLPRQCQQEPQAPSVFGGQKRCIQQSLPWDIRREPAANPPPTGANFYTFRRKSGSQHRREASPKRSFSRVCRPRAAASGSARISTDR